MAFDESGCFTADACTTTAHTNETTREPERRTRRRFKSKEKKAPAALPRFPSVEPITKIKAQFFDNGAENAKQGHSRYSLRIDALEQGQAFNDEVHWWRIVQLIAPETVYEWLNRQIEGKNPLVTEQVVERYQAALLAAFNAKENGDSVWMGHVYTPPGKTYIVDQFVSARMTEDGELAATLYVDGEQIDFKEFRKQKKTDCHHKAAKLWCVVEAETN
jgi:hypothetical protein